MLSLAAVEAQVTLSNSYKAKLIHCILNAEALNTLGMGRAMRKPTGPP